MALEMESSVINAMLAVASSQEEIPLILELWEEYEDGK
jgi:hypothetical protein